VDICVKPQGNSELIKSTSQMGGAFKLHRIRNFPAFQPKNMEERCDLTDLDVNDRIILNEHQRNKILRYILSSSGLGRGSVATACGCSNKPSGCTKGGDIHQLNNYQLLKSSSAPCIQLQPSQHMQDITEDKFNRQLSIIIIVQFCCDNQRIA
jgi:hypothetical protein